MSWKVSLLIFFLLSNFIFGQETNNSAEIKREFAELDSIAVDDLYVHDTVLLEDAKILHVNLKTEMEKKYYIWLRKESEMFGHMLKSQLTNTTPFKTPLNISPIKDKRKNTSNKGKMN